MDQRKTNKNKIRSMLREKVVLQSEERGEETHEENHQIHKAFGKENLRSLHTIPESGVPIKQLETDTQIQKRAPESSGKDNTKKPEMLEPHAGKESASVVYRRDPKDLQEGKIQENRRPNHNSLDYSCENGQNALPGISRLDPGGLEIYMDAPQELLSTRTSGCPGTDQMFDDESEKDQIENRPTCLYRRREQAIQQIFKATSERPHPLHTEELRATHAIQPEHEPGRDNSDNKTRFDINIGKVPVKLKEDIPAQITAVAFHSYLSDSDEDYEAIELLSYGKGCFRVRRRIRGSLASRIRHVRGPKHHDQGRDVTEEAERMQWSVETSQKSLPFSNRQVVNLGQDPGNASLEEPCPKDSKVAWITHEPIPSHRAIGRGRITEDKDATEAGVNQKVFSTSRLFQGKHQIIERTHDQAGSEKLLEKTIISKNHDQAEGFRKLSQGKLQIISKNHDGAKDPRRSEQSKVPMIKRNRGTDDDEVPHTHHVQVRRTELSVTHRRGANHPLGQHHSNITEQQSMAQDQPLASNVDENAAAPWPLHIPVSSGNIQVAELLKECGHAELKQEIEAIVVKEEKYLQAAQKIPKRNRSRFNCNNISDLHLENMVRAGTLRQYESEPIFWCKVFTLAETKKKRWRLIVEPRDLNNVIQYPKTKLPNIHDMIRLIHEGNYLVQWDLACWFYQIPLAEEIQKYFGVRIKGKNYVFTCLPMGFTASVFVAQQLALLVTRAVAQRRVYIDNIFTACNSAEEGEALKERMREELAARSVCIKESATESGEQLSILGIACNASHKSIALDATFVEKHREMLKMLIEGSVLQMKTRDLMKIIGTIFRGVYVLQLGFHNFFLTLITASRIAKYDLEDTLEWTVDSDTARLAKLILENKPVIYDKVTIRVKRVPVIVTDASREGFGYMWTYNGRIVFGGGQWQGVTNDNMPELEAAAGCIAIESLNKFGYGTKGAQHFTDSMTIILAEKKGHSKCEMLNKFVGLVKVNEIALKHVRSEENPVDGLSRGVPISNADLIKLDNLC